MNELKKATAAALCALLREGRRKDEIASLAGLTGPRMIDYTLDDNNPKSLGLKAVKRLAQNLGMSLEGFISFGNMCLKNEGNLANGSIALPMFGITARASHSIPNGIADSPAPYNDIDFAEVPLREATGSMGGGSIETGKVVKHHLKFRRDWLRSQGATSHISCIMAFGDSMSPTITDGSVILIDEGRAHFTSGKVFYVRYNGEMFVKRLTGALGSISIVSDSRPQNSIEVTDADDFEIIGRAMWMGRVID